MLAVYADETLRLTVTCMLGRERSGWTVLAFDRSIAPLDGQTGGAVSQGIAVVGADVIDADASTSRTAFGYVSGRLDGLGAGAAGAAFVTLPDGRTAVPTVSGNYFALWLPRGVDPAKVRVGTVAPIP